jgi:SAM-dependent methyltransferase
VDSYKETFDTWNKVAKLYQDKFMDIDLYNDTYDSFCAQLNMDDASILEIGCGPGNITKYLLNKNPALKIKGIDIAPNMIALAKANNPTADFKVMDCRVIDQLQDKFDGIVCGFCLPYMSEPDALKLIKDCSNLLTGTGVLYISFVEGDYLQSGFQTASSGDRTYFYYFPLEWLQRVLRDNGFKRIEVYRKVYERSVDVGEIHTILIAGK